jgi:hypothetical protein
MKKQTKKQNRKQKRFVKNHQIETLKKEIHSLKRLFEGMLEGFVPKLWIESYKLYNPVTKEYENPIHAAYEFGFGVKADELIPEAVKEGNTLSKGNYAYAYLQVSIKFTKKYHDFLLFRLLGPHPVLEDTQEGRMHKLTSEYELLLKLFNAIFTTALGALIITKSHENKDATENNPVHDPSL